MPIKGFILLASLASCTHLFLDLRFLSSLGWTHKIRKKTTENMVKTIDQSNFNRVESLIQKKKHCLEYSDFIL